MRVLGEYHAAVGAIIDRRAATLTSFAGDGLMILINAPVSCPDPALAALDLAMEVQTAVQRLIANWRKHGHGIGMGIGLAMGPATVGRIGYEGRIDYTAIGSAVNLASRLCSAAIDGQILVDTTVAGAVSGKIPLQAMGAIAIKGYDQPVPIFSIAATPHPCTGNAG